jgi:hypothetical protein
MYKALCSSRPHHIESRRDQKTKTCKEKGVPEFGGFGSQSTQSPSNPRKQTDKQTGKKPTSQKMGVSCTGDTMKNTKTRAKPGAKNKRGKHAGSNRVGKFARSSLEAQEVGTSDVGIGTPMLKTKDRNGE